ncbi:putative zinc finger E-box-binding homeobox 1 [Trichinella spiralis]|uniref:putative zinc finger E-box-binding homeobox 1 n=1 Tax=Trichinella spiralis TaxID=6334 RepID=UPI0001EFDDB4|nr:putative zinc finger E-box-binding homeobox 1 [Trichinella spiralis]
MAADDKPPFMDMDNDNLGQSLRFVDILDLRLVFFELSNLNYMHNNRKKDIVKIANLFVDHISIDR